MSLQEPPYYPARVPSDYVSMWVCLEKAQTVVYLLEGHNIKGLK